jgi:hypothetical protein
MLRHVRLRNLGRVFVAGASVLVVTGIGGCNLDPADPGFAPVTWVNHLPDAVTFTSCADDACRDEDELVTQKIRAGGRAEALLSEALPITWVAHRARDGKELGCITLQITHYQDPVPVVDIPADLTPCS